MLINKAKFTADKVVFFICLTTALSLFTGGFLVPPMGVIDGSVLSAGGMLLGFAALAVAALAIQDGRTAKFQKGDMEVCLGDNDDEKQVA